VTLNGSVKADGNVNDEDEPERATLLQVSLLGDLSECGGGGSLAYVLMGKEGGQPNRPNLTPLGYARGRL
jgi:hypothetical protein